MPRKPTGADVVLYADPVALEREVAVRKNPARKRDQVVEPNLSLFGKTAPLLVRTALIRSASWDPSKAVPVASSKSVGALLDHARNYDQEFLFVLACDSGLRCIAIHETAVGGSASVQQQFEHIAKVPFLVGAYRVILAHNHPSGNPSPSQDDVEFTKNAMRSFKCMEMQLLDHIIVASGGTYSFRDSTTLLG